MVEKTDIFSIRLILTGLSLLLCFSYFGCGIKGPPVPPRRLPVPAVKNLAYQVAVGSATLTWSLPGPLSGRQAEQIRRDLSQGQTAGINGTPALFVNGVNVPGGAVPYEVVAAAIERELRRVESD